jgi:hypothetical protein
MENKEVKNIYGKLSEARIRLQEKNLKKSGRNKFAGFSYYELADFLPEINRIFGDLLVYSIFSIKEKVATLCLINYENPNENVVFESPVVDVELKGCTPIQSVGAVHTYMKRYLYMNALEIVENDALDAQAGEIVNEIAKIDEIENIHDLNRVYKHMLAWKAKLKTKADSMGAVFNKDSRAFEVLAMV